MGLNADKTQFYHREHVHIDQIIHYVIYFFIVS